MPEPDNSPTNETPPTPPATDKPIKLDSSRPMAQQVDKLLEQLPAAEPATDEESKSEETPEPEAPADEGAKEDTDQPEEEVEETSEEEKPLEELPDWQHYVLDKLPQIQVLGHTANGKERVFNVKSYTELPADFEFASRRDELAFNAALASQEYRANELLKEYQAKEQERKAQEWRDKDAQEVQRDIQRLQQEGILPKFKYKSDDARFDSDPAVKEANEIYALRNKINSAYYSQGRGYFISFEDAADKYYAAKARQEKQAPKEPKNDSAPTPVQAQRQEVARRSANTQGADPGRQAKRMPAGSTMRDVLKLYNAGRI